MLPVEWNTKVRVFLSGFPHRHSCSLCINHLLLSLCFTSWVFCVPVLQLCDPQIKYIHKQVSQKLQYKNPQLTRSVSELLWPSSLWCSRMSSSQMFSVREGTRSFSTHFLHLLVFFYWINSRQSLKTFIGYTGLQCSFRLYLKYGLLK